MNTTRKLTEIALEYNQPLNKVIDIYSQFNRKLYFNKFYKDLDGILEGKDIEATNLTKRYYSLYFRKPMDLHDEIIDGWYKELR